MERGVTAILSNTDRNLTEVKFSSNQSGKTSLIVGENLFQSIKVNQNGEITHNFSINRKSVTGFKHSNYSGLKRNKVKILIICILSFPLITPITQFWTAPWFVGDIVFSTSLLMTLFLSGNPHLIVFNTDSDKYQIFFYQWGKDKNKITPILSNLGIAMSEFLVSREFSMQNVTYNIGRIGDTIATDSVVVEEQNSNTEIIEDSTQTIPHLEAQFLNGVQSQNTPPIQEAVSHDLQVNEGKMIEPQIEPEIGSELADLVPTPGLEPGTP